MFDLTPDGAYAITSLPAQLQSKVDSSDGDCWIWTAARTEKGYGKVGWDGRTWRAHRLIYELLAGPIPLGLQLDHLCRTRECVNPGHLEPVTNRENILRGDGPTAVNAQRTHCPRGHEYTEDNTRVYRGRRYCRACGPARRREGVDA